MLFQFDQQLLAAWQLLLGIQTQVLEQIAINGAVHGGFPGLATSLLQYRRGLAGRLQGAWL